MKFECWLLEKYRSDAIGEPGREIYFTSAVSLKIPADCDANDVAIIGVDTFTIDQGGTYLHMDGIADYSSAVGDPWDAMRPLCNRSARSMIEDMCAQKGPDTWFSFVFVEPGRPRLRLVYSRRC
ncbi:hypothetical protein [Paraburkholderia sp. BCC1886]|uniref:hypothetical protein n=1 Tax=Paraburkholderia sp. BCC1886 TaxID=2562670 RepID=UPI0011844F47|nr:hypothetical protein [Paraburkholderia sp. BCC1886]